MELTALGTSGGWPGAGRAASGYLLRHDGPTSSSTWGRGRCSRLQQLLDLDDLSGIVISHAHYDHFLDLYPLFIARFFEELPDRADPRRSPRSGFFDHLYRLTEDGGADMRTVIEPREVGARRDTTELGPFRIEARPMTPPRPDHRRRG